MDIRGKTIQNGEPTPEYPCEIENKINLTGAIEILKKLKSKVTLVEADEKEYRLPFLMDIEKQAIETVLSELEKKDKVINEYEKECRQFKAFCKRVRRYKKHDVDLFNQGQEHKCNQFLNLISGEPHWSYEGKYFDDTDNQIKQYFERKVEEDNHIGKI